MIAHKPVRCLLSVFSVVLLVAGCQPQKQNRAPEGQTSSSKNPNSNLPVATIGDTKITVGMLEDELNKQNPYLRMRFASPERRKEFLKNLVKFEVLAAEAKRRGLETDPEVVRRVKRAMIDRMMEELQTTLVKMEGITDKDVTDYYNTNLAQYQQPAKVRASWIVLASAAEAQKVLAEAKTKPKDVAFFGELAKKHSIDETTKSNRGDLDFFTRESTKVPKEVSEAAFATPTLWGLTGPVKTAKGYAVVMRTGELPAVNHSLDSEKERIKSRIYNERRIKAVESFIDDLQAKSKVVIDDKALEKVKVDLEAKPPAGGFHGGPHGWRGGPGGMGGLRPPPRVPPTPPGGHPPAGSLGGARPH